MRKRKSQTSSFRKLRRGIREMHALVPGILLWMLAFSIPKSLLPFVNVYCSAKLVDLLYNGKDTNAILFVITTAIVLNFLLLFLNRTFEVGYGVKLNLLFNKEANRINEKLFSMDYTLLEDAAFQENIRKYTDNRRQRGSALWRITWMIESIISGVLIIVISIAMLWTFFGAAFRRAGEGFLASPWLAIVIVIALLVGVIIVMLISGKSSKAFFHWNDQFLQINKVFSFYSDMVTDYTTGKEIRVYKEQEMIKSHASDQMLTKGVWLQRKIAMNQGVTGSLMAVISALLACGVYILIGVKGLMGLFSIGSLVKFSGAFLQIVQGFITIGTIVGQTKIVVPGLDYYFGILDAEDKKKTGCREIDMQPDQMSIVFDHVSFRYPGTSDYAIEDLSIKIEPGSRLAVVGRNGSGKTTFIKLLCRMYDVTSGRILLNGIDIREYDEETYRKLFAVVFQDFDVFSFTVGQDVAVGDSYSSERISASLADAGLDHRMQGLDDGADTYVSKDLSEEGVEFSGGELQKLSLARALYKESPVIILDEPAAALDPIAEYEMYTRFNHFVGDKTAVYISHRLSSCRFCSTIAVFDHGRLVQQGTHEQLVHDEQGKYYELWHAQSQYYVNI